MKNNKDKKEHIISNLKHKRDKMLFDLSPEEFENQINDAEIDHTSSMLLKFDRIEALKLEEAESNAIVIGKSPESNIKAKRKVSKPKAAIGALISVAAIGLLAINLNSTNAGVGNGFLNFFGSKEDLSAFVATMEYGSYTYKSYDELLPEYRKQLWKFEHETIPLDHISLQLTQRMKEFKSFYATGNTPDDLFFNIGLTIPNENVKLGIDIGMYDFEYQDSVRLDETNLDIYKANTPEKEDRPEYLITFYVGQLQYSVMGNLALYELQGIANQYLDFALN